MIDTLHLLPPDFGPRSNPMLYGVAEAIAELFPPVMSAPRPCEDTTREVRSVETPDVPAETVAAG